MFAISLLPYSPQQFININRLHLSSWIQAVFFKFNVYLNSELATWRPTRAAGVIVVRTKSTICDTMLTPKPERMAPRPRAGEQAPEDTGSANSSSNSREVPVSTKEEKSPPGKASGMML
jgi:hypothetical protein